MRKAVQWDMWLEYVKDPNGPPCKPELTAPLADFIPFHAFKDPEIDDICKYLKAKYQAVILREASQAMKDEIKEPITKLAAQFDAVREALGHANAVDLTGSIDDQACAYLCEQLMKLSMSSLAMKCGYAHRVVQWLSAANFVRTIKWDVLPVEPKFLNAFHTLSDCWDLRVCVHIGMAVIIWVQGAPGADGNSSEELSEHPAG